MPDVTPCLHPGQVRRWISFDQHKFSIVAAVLPPDGGKPEVVPDRDDREGDPPVHRQAGRAGRRVGLL